MISILRLINHQLFSRFTVLCDGNYPIQISFKMTIKLSCLWSHLSDPPFRYIYLSITLFGVLVILLLYFSIIRIKFYSSLYFSLQKDIGNYPFHFLSPDLQKLLLQLLLFFLLQISDPMMMNGHGIASVFFFINHLRHGNAAV